MEIIFDSIILVVCCISKGLLIKPQCMLLEISVHDVLKEELID